MKISSKRSPRPNTILWTATKSEAGKEGPVNRATDRGRNMPNQHRRPTFAIPESSPPLLPIEFVSPVI